MQRLPAGSTGFEHAPVDGSQVPGPWQAAGGGHTNAGQIAKPVLRAFYEDTNFLRSVTVTKIEHEIAHPSPLHPGHP